MASLIGSIGRSVRGAIGAVQSVVAVVDERIHSGVQKVVHAVPTSFRNLIIRNSNPLLVSISLGLLGMAKDPMGGVLCGSTVIMSGLLLSKDLLKTLEPSYAERLKFHPEYANSAFRKALLQESSKPKPPLLVLIAVDDHNGALSIDNENHCLASLASKYEIQIEFIQNSWDLGFYIEKYSRGKKIPVMVMAHGLEDAMFLSRAGVSGVYKKDMVRSGDFDGANDLILWSCSTGAKGGIGERIAQTHPGLVVMAPEKPASSCMDFASKVEPPDVEFFHDGQLLTRKICTEEQPQSFEEVKAKIQCIDPCKEGVRFALIKRGADLGDADAQVEYGDFLFGSKKTRKEAVSYYRKAAAQNHPSARMMMSQLYFRGGYGVKKNAKLANKHLKKGIEQGDPNRIGACVKALHCRPGSEKSIEWLERAAEGGFGYIERRAGQYYLRRGEDQKAFYWMQKAADHDDRAAKKTLSWMYRRGIGVARDLRQADFWKC